MVLLDVVGACVVVVKVVVVVVGAEVVVEVVAVVVVEGSCVELVLVNVVASVIGLAVSGAKLYLCINV